MWAAQVSFHTHTNLRFSSFGWMLLPVSPCRAWIQTHSRSWTWFHEKMNAAELKREKMKKINIFCVFSWFDGGVFSEKWLVQQRCDKCMLKDLCFKHSPNNTFILRSILLNSQLQAWPAARHITFKSIIAATELGFSSGLLLPFLQPSTRGSVGGLVRKSFSSTSLLELLASASAAQPSPILNKWFLNLSSVANPIHHSQHPSAEPEPLPNSSVPSWFHLTLPEPTWSLCEADVGGYKRALSPGVLFSKILPLSAEMILSFSSWWIPGGNFY